jgi:hypothetical protein
VNVDLVVATPILTTDFIVFSAWCADPADAATQRWHEDRYYGRVGTYGPPQIQYAYLPEDWAEYVEEWYRTQRAEAIQGILEHEPKLVECGRLDFGTGEVWCWKDDLS